MNRVVWPTGRLFKPMKDDAKVFCDVRPALMGGRQGQTSVIGWVRTVERAKLGVGWRRIQVGLGGLGGGARGDRPIDRVGECCEESAATLNEPITIISMNIRARAQRRGSIRETAIFDGNSRNGDTVAG